MQAEVETVAERVRRKIAQLRAKQDAKAPLVRALTQVCHALGARTFGSTSDESAS